jgi:hypothetical protein
MQVFYKYMVNNIITFNTDTAFEIIYKQLFVKKTQQEIFGECLSAV